MQPAGHRLHRVVTVVPEPLHLLVDPVVGWVWAVDHGDLPSAQRCVTADQTTFLGLTLCRIGWTSRRDACNNHSGPDHAQHTPCHRRPEGWNGGAGRFADLFRHTAWRVRAQERAQPARRARGSQSSPSIRLRGMTRRLAGATAAAPARRPAPRLPRPTPSCPQQGAKGQGELLAVPGGRLLFAADHPIGWASLARVI